MADALIVIDVQNDFCAGGSLAVPEGDSVVPVMNEYLARATAAGIPIFASRDWHPRETTHFQQFGGAWPVHCVQNTPGAAFHPDLRLPPATRVVTTGSGPRDEGYSAFEGHLDDGRGLADALHDAGVTRVYVGGLATDYCVRATVLGARQLGLETIYLADASRPVDVHQGDGARAEQEMRDAGAGSATLADFQPRR